VSAKAPGSDPSIPTVQAFTALEDRRRSLADKVYELVGDRERPLRVLDIGCGTGQLLCDLARGLPRAKLVGIDIAPDGIRIAEAERAKQGLDTASRLAFERHDYLAYRPETTFDLIVSESCLQFVPGPDDALFEKIAGELAPRGLLVISMPYGSLRNRVIAHARRVFRILRSRLLDRLALALAKRFHPDVPATLLEQRISYLYAVPTRLEDRRLRTLLDELGLSLEGEALRPVKSALELAHRVTIFRKR